MSRPKLFRDPVHGQIRYEKTGEADPFPGSKKGRGRTRAAVRERQVGWLIQRLMDCPEFQRLRHCRQNGVTNLVFHGAEHSRFAHSMGAAFLAREMFERIERNADRVESDAHFLATVAAALLHDVGHGPFSHALEHILERCGVDFDHERMTERFIEEDSSIHAVLSEVDPQFPQEVANYVRKKRPVEHWRYRIVSSQLDADRLDYLLRDARSVGLDQHSFDLSRLLEFLEHLDGTRIAVDRRGLEAVESYLVMLDHMYRAVYFHHAVRAASCLLESVFARAVALDRAGMADPFGRNGPGANPFVGLIGQGVGLDLSTYARLGEFHAWELIERWQASTDTALADLSRRLMRRDLFKAIDVRDDDYKAMRQLDDRAKDLTRSSLGFVDDTTIEHYVVIDEPKRTSYKWYNWREEDRVDESIWIVGLDKPQPIESYKRSRIVQGLKETQYLPRLLVTAEVRDRLNSGAGI